MEFPLNIDIPRLCDILSCKAESLPAICKQRVATAKMRFRLLTPADRDAHMLKVLTRFEDPTIKRSTEANIEAFEAGWRENYDLCRAKGLTRENLKPKYMRPYTCLRLQSEYVCPENPHLLDDLHWISVNQSFDCYLRDIEHAYEFGCGTGQYLYDLALMFPEKTLVGTDWTKSSGMILGLMAEKGMKVSGQQFDMMKPDRSFKLKPGSGIFTVGALEQIGPNFGAFLEYLLENKPRIVVHHEPIEDFYRTDNLVDYLGLMHHRRRGYLQGYLPALRELEKSGKIKIVEAARVSFGDSFHESGSRIVWQML